MSLAVPRTVHAMGGWTREEFEARVAATKEQYDALGDYSSRQWICPPSERWESYSQEFDQLEKETNPLLAELSAHGKDLAAFQALQSAGRLVNAVAGWAIDHELGLALKGLSFVPLAPEPIPQDLQYREARNTVDSHDHERLGSAVRRDLSFQLDPIAARRALLNILRPLADVFLAQLYQMAIEGLEALEFGEYTPIFEKKDIRLHYRYQELKLQLAALAHVEFQSKFVRRFDAQWEVAEAYGVDADTLRQWIGPLRERLGKLEVLRARAFARNCAINAIHAQKAKRAGKTNVIDVWSRRHDAIAIKRDGDAFKALRASKMQNKAI